MILLFLLSCVPEPPQAGIIKEEQSNPLDTQTVKKLLLDVTAPDLSRIDLRAEVTGLQISGGGVLGQAFIDNPGPIELPIWSDATEGILWLTVDTNKDGNLEYRINLGEIELIDGLSRTVEISKDMLSQSYPPSITAPVHKPGYKSITGKIEVEGTEVIQLDVIKDNSKLQLIESTRWPSKAEYKIDLIEPSKIAVICPGQKVTKIISDPLIPGSSWNISGISCP